MLLSKLASYWNKYSIHSSRICSAQFGPKTRNRSNASARKIIGIKRETVNLWERRSPLTPDQVKRLTDDGIRVLVEPSRRRCFSAAEFEAVGAEINRDLSEASLILGVKRPTKLTTADLLPWKTYSFFTHTIKGQPDNMDLLDVLLERNIRMLDYECMVNEDNARLVAFGEYAGLAGTIDILHGLGIRLLSLGYSTPFLQIAMTHNYANLALAKQSIQLAGYELTRGHLPQSVGPLVFVIHGDGNVARGAQAILNCLPVRYVSPEQLAQISQSGAKTVIYACIVTVDHYMVHVDGKPFDKVDYFENPENYKSTFDQKIAPYMSVLINATYWDARIDRILTKHNVRRLSENAAKLPMPHRLLAISDISADLVGSVEFTEQCTTIDEPFALYNPITEETTKGIVGDGILMCSIDNMPTQLPIEASEHFGTVLFPFINDMIRSDAKKPFEEYVAQPTVKNAIITSNGKLTPRFQYIEELRTRPYVNQGPSSGRKVLILGAGYVVPSVIDYLLRDKTIQLTVASNQKEELQHVTNKYNHVTSVPLDILQDEQLFGKLVEENDLTVSLIPWKFHPVVVRKCVEKRRNLLTASYCTPALKELEDDIQSAGITAFMEIGLDPGIDHLLTKQSVDEIASRGGQLISYRSYTGGLPAPESSGNPLRYKFSWSPEAALSTVMNGAKYLECGQIKEIPADGSLMKMAAPMEIYPGFNLEGYPNRDSTRYIDLYGLTNCETVIRGTLRYKGYAEAMSFLLSLGLFDNKNGSGFHTGSWRQFICQKLGIKDTLTGGALKSTLLSKFDGDEAKYECLRRLGFLSDDPMPRMETQLASTSDQLAKLLTYGPTERDLIIMSHELVIDWPREKKRETRKVNLVAYGQTGQGRAGLAMSRTVGLPTAIAANMMLNGEIPDKGIVLPLKPHIYTPILRRLKEQGIEAQEESSFVYFE